jgi:hypothetical protein
LELQGSVVVVVVGPLLKVVVLLVVVGPLLKVVVVIVVVVDSVGGITLKS